MSSDAAPVPLSLPDLDGDWSAWLTERCDTALTRAGGLRDELVADASDPLEVWNRLGIALANGVHAAHLMSQVHPDPDLREEAEKHVVAAEKFRTELLLDARVYAALVAVDPAGLDDDARRGLGPGSARSTSARPTSCRPSPVASAKAGAAPRCRSRRWTGCRRTGPRSTRRSARSAVGG